MQAVAKMPHTEIKVKGVIPERLVSFLRKEGATITFMDDDGEELISAKETEWYKKTKARMTPGDVMRLYRTMKNMTQEELGEKLGGVDRQNISAMEKGSRPISGKTAHKLADIFGVSHKKFL